VFGKLFFNGLTQEDNPTQGIAGDSSIVCVAAATAICGPEAKNIVRLNSGGEMFMICRATQGGTR
jgi:hypothetical protein